MTYPHQEPTATPQRTRPARRPWLVIAVAAGALIAGMWWLGAATSTVAGRAVPAEAEPVAALATLTALEQAVSDCAGGEIQDDGSTLILDMAVTLPDGSKDYATGDTDAEDLGCVLESLDTPESIIQQMEQTRALDGMQSGSWGEFEAKWTYHPDDGLDVIFTES